MVLCWAKPRIQGQAGFTYVAPGFTPEYRNGAIFITPEMWAWLCAVHIAEFYKPEAVRWGDG